VWTVCPTRGSIHLGHGTDIDLMPRKVRELIGDLERAGFINRGGKGPDRNYEHPRGGRVTLSGQPGDDAKPYQEREVRRAIEESRS
jgi:predicted RNA binding protein YcfA (HicA-like mRNA interferase family)